MFFYALVLVKDKRRRSFQGKKRLFGFVEKTTANGVRV